MKHDIRFFIAIIVKQKSNHRRKKLNRNKPDAGTQLESGKGHQNNNANELVMTKYLKRCGKKLTLQQDYRACFRNLYPDLARNQHHIAKEQPITQLTEYCNDTSD